VTAPLLEVSELRVRFGDEVDALRGVNLSLARGESVAIVGESGAGKSTLAQCLVGLIQPPEAGGSVRVDGHELLGGEPELLRSLRWSTVAIALQGAPFNPVASIGDQIAEPLRERAGMTGVQALRRSQELAEELLLDRAALERFPHQLSGGERRRATLAMVLALDPELVILDEPTAGLDPTGRAELLDRVRQLSADRGFALVTVSHDLPAAASLSARTMVLYAGEAMELGQTSRVIGRPAHPYSWALVNAYPVMGTSKDLRPIRGRSPDPRNVPAGCPFHPRCTQAEAICRGEHPPLEPSRDRLVACHFGGLKILLSAAGLHKTFGRGKDTVRALRGVSLEIREGESVGVIGPSGSGKSTLARVLAGHLSPDSGEVLLGGARMERSWGSEARAARRRIQLVMQDPWEALSPRLPVVELVREPSDIAGTGSAPTITGAVEQALEAVGLPSAGSFLRAYPHELSGGELQRVALARALVAGPKLLVADEPTSMLDASEQARLLVVLRERQVEMGLGLVLVSHDVAVVRKVTDRIVVLDAGEVVEEGSSQHVSSAPQSLTARRLVQAAPALGLGDGDGDGDGRPNSSTEAGAT